METVRYKKALRGNILGLEPFEAEYQIKDNIIKQVNPHNEIRSLKEAGDKITILIEAFKDVAWMARRYADGRMTYATSTYNEAIRRALDCGVYLSLGGDGTVWARDGHGRKCDHLSDDEAAMGQEVDVWGLIKSEEIDTLKKRIQELEFENSCLKREVNGIQLVKELDKSHGTDADIYIEPAT